MTSAPDNKSYSHSAEVGVLGSLLISPVDSMTLCKRLRVSRDYFYVPAHGEVFDAMLKLADRGTVIDYLTVGSELGSLKGWTEQGWQKLLEYCIDETPTACHCEHYLSILHDKFVSREALACAGDVQKLALSGAGPDEIIDRMNRGAVSLVEAASTGQRSSKFSDVSRMAYDQWAKLANGTETISIASKYKALNEIMLGYRNELTVIGGYRAVGKTTHLTDEALAMAMRGIPVLIISLETAVEQVAQKILGNMSNFSTFKFDCAMGQKEEWEMLEHNMRDLAGKLPIHIVNCDDNINSVIQQIEFHIAKYGVEAVFLDYLQLISWHHHVESRVREVGNITRKLATHCLGRYALVVYSQFTRSSEHEDRDPEIRDLRDAGNIENDARKIVLIYSDRETRSFFWFDVAKHNAGPTGRVKMQRLANKQRWVPEIIKVN